VSTDIRRATVFYKAQADHQAYLENNPNGYCNHRVRFKEWPRAPVRG
jgi:peptide-methionine (S)-S-oxide reductase